MHQLHDLIRLYEDVFEMKDFVMPGDEYLQSLLNKSGVTFLVAVKEGEIVGGLTAHDLPSPYFEANEVYVYDLAVAKKHQCMGIGKKIIKRIVCNL